MKIILKRGLHRGEEVEVFIEVMLDGRGRYTISSELRNPTTTDVERLMNIQCNHDSQNEALIYDKPSFFYDERYCAVCGMSLGLV